MKGVKRIRERLGRGKDKVQISNTRVFEIISHGGFLRSLSVAWFSKWLCNFNLLTFYLQIVYVDRKKINEWRMRAIKKVE